MPALSVIVGKRDRRQIVGCSSSYRKVATAASGTDWPLGARNCRLRNVSIEPRSEALAPPDHLDQIDIVANLRHRGAIDNAIQRRGNVLRGDAELAGLVLQNIDLDDPRRLHPVEHDITKMLVAGDDARELPGVLPHPGDIRTAQAILHRTSDRRSDIQQLHEGVGARKRPFQIVLKFAF